jgi:DNA-binding MarR family transcriptional regulator
MAIMSVESPPSSDVAAVRSVRAFNRFYTQRIGVLKRYLDTDFTLTEVRVLYELAHRPPLAARDLVRDLELDAGYLSRILRRFEDKGWLARETAAHDARQHLLRLTEAGYATFAPLQQKSREETATLLAAVAPAARPRLIQALDTVHRLLEPDAGTKRKVVLRDPRPGDMGWVVQAAWRAVRARVRLRTAEFEALVAEIAGQVPAQVRSGLGESCWIAEVDGERAGCRVPGAQVGHRGAVAPAAAARPTHAGWAWADGSPTNASPSRA